MNRLKQKFCVNSLIYIPIICTVLCQESFIAESSRKLSKILLLNLHQIYREETSESWNEYVDKAEQKRQLAALKAYNLCKAKLCVPIIYESKLWRKIAETVREKCPNSGYYGGKECRDDIHSIKKKYSKVKKGKLDVTSPDDEILIEEANLAFDSIGPVSDKEIQERQLAALKAYNLYKDEFSMPNVCELELWRQIAGIVREEYQSSGYYDVQQCRDEVRSMKNKYFKVGKLDDAILTEEAKLAFDTIRPDNINSCGRDRNQWNDRMGYGEGYPASDYSSPGEFVGKSYGYRRDSYESGHGSKSQNGRPNASNDGIIEYGQDYGYMRDSYGSGYGNNNQRGPPNASNEGNEYGRCYRRDSYGGGYGSNNQDGPSSVWSNAMGYG